MKLTVVVDNNTFIDQYYNGEPAICFYIEDDEDKLLLDTGYSDLFIKNAELLGLDISQISAIVLSHGHNDHTGGLKYLFDKQNMSNTSIIAHSNAFTPKRLINVPIGSPLSEAYLRTNSNLSLSKGPTKVSKHITFLGEIPSLNDFEKRKSFGKLCNSTNDEDFVMDDSALVYNNGKGLFIITGCSHSGICNIIEYAKQVCEDSRIIGVIGGFHLFEVSDALTSTIDYFKRNNIKELYPCHCVSFAVKAEIHKYIPIHEVGVGLKIEIQ